MKLSHPKHKGSVPAHPACPPHPAGSVDIVTAPAGPVLCVGAGCSELGLGCTVLPPSQHVAGSSSGPWRAPVALMAWGQCSEVALEDTLVTG